MANSAAPSPFLSENNLHFFSFSLDPGDLFPEPLRDSCFVYAIVSDNHSAALINTGPAICRTQLIEKLDEIGLSKNSVQRIVLTNWDVRHLGNLSIFPNAVTFALSPDRIKPYNYNAVLEHQRYRLRALLDELQNASDSNLLSVKTLKKDHDTERALEEFITLYYDAPMVVPFAPLKEGDLVNLLGIHFDVIDQSAFFKGQLALYCHELKLLFGLSTPFLGLPAPFYSPAAVIPMLERLASIDLKIIASNHHGVETHPQWLLKRSRAFMKSFFENAPSSLRKKPTLLEFLDQNFGHIPDSVVELLFELIKFQDALNELARDEEISIDGAGIANRRYGMNVLDPRPSKLQY